MKNKVTNRFFIKLILYLNLTKFEGNTENTRSSIDDRGSERVKNAVNIEATVFSRGMPITNQFQVLLHVFTSCYKHFFLSCIHICLSCIDICFKLSW